MSSETPLVESIDWLAPDEAIAVWSYPSGAPCAVAVHIEYEPADPEVGYLYPQWSASGDAPLSVLDEVAFEASQREVERRAAKRDDAYQYASESHFAGGAL